MKMNTWVDQIICSNFYRVGIPEMLGNLNLVRLQETKVHFLVADGILFYFKGSLAILFSGNI